MRSSAVQCQTALDRTLSVTTVIVPRDYSLSAREGTSSRDCVLEWVGHWLSGCATIYHSLRYWGSTRACGIIARPVRAKLYYERPFAFHARFFRAYAACRDSHA